MEIINNKYYEGYEGEGEMQFIRYLSNGDKYVLKIWDGYFDEIMREIQPEENGWTGLAYYYNVEEPWWERPWKIQDIDIVIKQLRNIKTEQLNKEAKELLIELCDILSSSWELNEDVWIADE
ncbi:hypothetical protein SAMN05661091_4919 [Paenibacillus uliginis N3/975]|uniref:Uncharacterized protein n=1 Tax=Paenibacillus uliginis N3/975 TaxID=1313296 RepID=A0A1X7HP64_9BACL|nr:hypothetical protein [Paenibacillus uliginis]SMF90172.1 hypothetical protein SAMN05661091_4919 [Paenibacillus uliginis N3/975]